jgi:hypothetical protein
MEIWFNCGHLKVINWNLVTIFEKKTTHENLGVVIIQ